MPSRSTTRPPAASGWRSGSPSWSGPRRRCTANGSRRSGLPRRQRPSRRRPPTTSLAAGGCEPSVAAAPRHWRPSVPGARPSAPVWRRPAAASPPDEHSMRMRRPRSRRTTPSPLGPRADRAVAESLAALGVDAEARRRSRVAPPAACRCAAGGAARGAAAGVEGRPRGARGGRRRGRASTASAGDGDRGRGCL